MTRIYLILSTFLLSPLAGAADTTKLTRPGPVLTEPVGVGLGSFLQMFFGLALIVALIVGMAWFMRRMNSIPGGGQGSLRILGGLSLGQRERVVLLQVGQEQLLVGLAPGQIRTLHVLERPVEVTLARSPRPGQGKFADRLQELLKGKLQP